LLDAGWRFQLGDPADVTTNVTYYPEIPIWPSWIANEVTGTNTSSETYMETIRVDPIATHAGENVSFVQTNYNDSAWRSAQPAARLGGGIAFQFERGRGHGFKPVGNSSFTINNIGWYRHTFTLPAGYAGQALWLDLTAFIAIAWCG
jgi:hypothetical protein